MTRIIARLDIKNQYLIKGVHLEGLRKLGAPNEFARRYYEQGADELIYMDAVASLYERNNLLDIVKQTAQNVFIPITVGGGVRSIGDAQLLLNSGADKVAVNTAAIKRPALITEMAQRFGAQCVVLSVEAKKQPDGSWEAYTDNGRERTGLKVVDWVKQAASLGIGEILITSIDQEGTRKGFDIALTKAVSTSVNVPIITSGGAGTLEHIKEVISEGNADAVAIADMLHYQRTTVDDIKRSLQIENHKNSTQLKLPKKPDSVSIIDYGMGNLFSVEHACRALGAEVSIATTASDVEKAKRIILPGVGAFKDGMNELKERGLDKAIIDAASKGTPILGICLGMQMLLEESQEHGSHKGLGLISGKVVPIPSVDSNGKQHKVPFIGWSKLELINNDSFLSEINADNLVYFVHSFYAQTANDDDTIAITRYSDQRITAAVQHENVIGTQFHPERSGINGIAILKSFLSL